MCVENEGDIEKLNMVLALDTSPKRCLPFVICLLCYIKFVPLFPLQPTKIYVFPSSGKLVVQ